MGSTWRAFQSSMCTVVALTRCVVPNAGAVARSFSLRYTEEKGDPEDAHGNVLRQVQD
jgi:hypothetical protein